MATLNVRATVSAPSEVNVPLVRGDYASTAGVFGFFFDVFLGLSGVLLGHILSLQAPLRIHWVFLGVSLIAMVAFWVLARVYSAKAKAKPYTDVWENLKGARKSSNDCWVGGVFGGLGTATPIPSWIWRTVFLISVLGFGVGLVVYVVLWI